MFLGIFFDLVLGGLISTHAHLQALPVPFREFPRSEYGDHLPGLTTIQVEALARQTSLLPTKFLLRRVIHISQQETYFSRRGTEQFSAP